MPCDDCSRADKCPPCVNEECSHEAWEENGGWCTCTDCGHGWSAASEPPGSASSSPDEDCATCGHWRDSHNTIGDHCNVCHTIDSASRRCIHDFVPAEPEAPTAAQEAAMDELTHLRQEMEATEPEAPECEHPRPYSYGLESGPPVRRFWLCQDCKAKWETVGDEPTGEARPPRRPPYAVAYATEGGAQYEIALPGDATIRFADGALIITHASAVLALTQARPMEGA